MKNTDRLLKYLFEQDNAEPTTAIEKPGIAPPGAKPVPMDAPPDKQVHVYDFDDTIGTTPDGNGLMLYNQGVSAWKTAQDAQQWCSSNGITDKMMLKGPNGQNFEEPLGPGNGFAAYVNSSGLATARKAMPAPTQGQKNILTAPAKPGPEIAGPVLVADYSPSSKIGGVVPIEDTISRIKSLPTGVKSQIVTARTGESTRKDGQPVIAKDFAGVSHPPSVEGDLQKFIKGQGLNFTEPLVTMGGGNKGEQIKKTYFDGKSPEEQPEEVHFYDDDAKNIGDVKTALAGKVPAEVFLYGPGDFADDGSPSNPDFPSESNPAATPKQDKNANKSPDQQAVVAEGYLNSERLQILAGIKKRY